MIYHNDYHNILYHIISHSYLINIPVMSFPLTIEYPNPIWAKLRMNLQDHSDSGKENPGS